MKGIVVKSTGSWYNVKMDDGVIKPCRIKGKFRIKGIKSTNPIAVGDVVEVNFEKDGVGVIHQLHKRKNYIIRKSTNLSKQTQILASNLDQAALIISVSHPKTPFGFIDRFLATAEAYNVPVLLVFNKMDLCNSTLKKEVESAVKLYESLAYSCVQTSAINQLNLEELKALLKDKTTLLSGQSGVGKSTLINTIEPSLNLKTLTVSEYNEKGRHTTTFAEMFEFSFGGNVIDTPGIRSFGVVDFDKYLFSHYFRDLFKASENCKFSDCMHIEEPHCAVKEGVKNGTIAQSRYTSYLNLYFDEDLMIR